MFEKNIELAKNWLLNSGIQNIRDIKDLKGVNLKGSFNSWFDLDNNVYPYAYSEITGYAITTLLFLYNLEGKKRKKKEKKEKIKFLQRAKLAADWLISIKKKKKKK